MLNIDLHVEFLRHHDVTSLKALPLKSPAYAIASADVMTLKEPILVLRTENMVTLVFIVSTYTKRGA